MPDVIEKMMKDSGNTIVDRTKPPVDPPTDPPKDPPTDSPKDPPKDAPKDPPKDPPTDPPKDPPAYDKFKVINEAMGHEFKTDEDITTWKQAQTDSTTKYTDLETRHTALEKENKELQESFDPMELFASPQLFVFNELTKKFPDKNAVILSEIATRDFSKSHLDNPVEVLALDLMLEKPGVYTSMADAQEDVLAKYDIEDPEELKELDSKTKRRMQSDAMDSVKKFTELKTQIEIPDKVDLAAKKQEKADTESARVKKMEDATEPIFTKKIPDALKDLEFSTTIKDEAGKEVTEVAFTYEIGESYAKSKAVQSILAAVRKDAIRNGTEWTPEKAAEVEADTIDLLKASYLYHNRDKVYAAQRDDLFTKFKDEAWMKRHNVRPLRQDGKVETPDKTTEENIRKRDDFEKSIGIKVS